MRHLFVIQCHEFEQSKELANLLKSINPEFSILMSCDTDNLNVGIKLTEEGLPTISYPQKYYSIDAALTHLYRFRYLTKLDFDWVHVISGKDLPFIGIFEIDKICEGRDIICQLDGDMKYGIPHGATWYSVSKKVANIIDKEMNSILLDSLKNWIYYMDNKCNGGFDEYVCAGMLTYVRDILNVTNPSLIYSADAHRFIVFPNYPDSDKYGKSNSPASPITFNYSIDLMEMVDCNHYLFGRKFDFDTEAYEKVISYIKNY